MKVVIVLLFFCLFATAVGYHANNRLCINCPPECYCGFGDFVDPCKRDQCSPSRGRHRSGEDIKAIPVEKEH
ncbi:hypothetical protein AAVH_34503 [Aphelenchoides avenae]|nr:hypothetical protein AAVH_34503 [Aphelenchus avenae]